MIAKKKPIALAIILILAGFAIFAWQRGGDRDDSTAPVRISGNIEAHESVVGFKVQGRLAELKVEEGAYVKVGDPIATLDRSDYEQQVRTDEALVAAREAELALAQAGSRGQEVRAGTETVADTEAELKLRRLEFARYQALYEKDVVSAQARDVAATNLKRAEAAYRRSQENLSQLKEGSRKEQIAISQANVKTARQNLEMARIRLGYTTLTAPASGVITVRQAEVGEIMAPGTPVVTIADLDRLWLRGYVPETDLGRVRWGAPAAVKTDTFPGKSYHGKISFISSQAEFTPKSVETHKERVTLVYRIKIDLENANRELKPGMPADAEISQATSAPAAK